MLTGTIRLPPRHCAKGTYGVVKSKKGPDDRWAVQLAAAGGTSMSLKEASLSVLPRGSKLALDARQAVEDATVAAEMDAMVAGLNVQSAAVIDVCGDGSVVKTILKYG